MFTVIIVVNDKVEYQFIMVHPWLVAVHFDNGSWLIQDWGLGSFSGSSVWLTNKVSHAYDEGSI